MPGGPVVMREKPKYSGVIGVGFAPSLEPRFQGGAHPDDKGSPAEGAGVGGAELITVGFAVRGHQVD